MFRRMMLPLVVLLAVAIAHGMPETYDADVPSMDQAQPDPGAGETDALWLFYDNGTNSTGNGITDVNYVAVSFLQPAAGVVGRIRVSITTGTGGTTARFHLRSDQSGVPGAVIWESDDINVIAGWVEIPVPWVAVPATFHVAIRRAPGATITLTPWRDSDGLQSPPNTQWRTTNGGTNWIAAGYAQDIMIRCYWDLGIPGLWTGNVSTDWNASGNWDNLAVPDASLGVTIPTGLSNYPTTNTGLGYDCASLTIEDGASMAVVSGLGLTCGNIANAGTLTNEGDVKCADIQNSGTLTNNGVVELTGDFVNTGDFSSGAGSEFHFLGSGTVSLNSGVDASASFFDVFVSTLDPTEYELGGGDPTLGGGSWFGSGTMRTFVTKALPATRAGSIVRWQLDCWYSVSQARVKVFRANYNGYQFGLVNQGPWHPTPSSGGTPTTFHDVVSGVEPGDWVGFAYDNTRWGGVGNEGFYYAVGDVGNYTGWSQYTTGNRPRMRAYMVGPGGGLETVGDVDVDGDLVINEDRDLTITSGDYSLGGDLVNDGTLDIGTADFTFDGNTSFSGAGGVPDFNGVTITGTLNAPDALVVNGDWSCSGTFVHGDGSVWFGGGSITPGGQAFHDLEVENTADGDVTLVGDLAVENKLKLTAGNFALAENTLTLGTAGARGAVEVAGGTFSAVGTETDARGTVTAVSASQPYRFDVMSGAAIAAQHANFTWMDVGGIYVQDGATIDAANNFSHCSFTASNDVGTMLKIRGSQVIDSIAWADFYGSNGYNIDYDGGTGSITVVDGEGARWGEDYDLDPADRVAWLVSTIHDVSAEAILVPTGSIYSTREVFPKAVVKNRGDVAEAGVPVRMIIAGPGEAEVYNEVVYVDLAFEQEKEVAFTVGWTPEEVGEYSVACQTELAGDKYPDNDRVEGTCTVEELPPWPEGWHEAASVPVLPSNKPLKDGAWLAVGPDKTDEGEVIYAAKGNKATDFYKYNPAEGENGTWYDLNAIPEMEDGKRKPPSKGTRGVAGDGAVYMTRGNNMLGFYKYDVEQDTWLREEDVPLGDYKKKVKGGNDMVYVVRNDTGYVYLLKGQQTEFYRFNTLSGKWETREEVPYQTKKKYDKGSFLVYDGGNTIYAHQAKVNNGANHYMFAFDLVSQTWSPTAKKGIPVYAREGDKTKKKKVADGAAGAWSGNNLYAFKGGNTQSFFKYTVAQDTWVELDNMPALGSTMKNKRIKAGGHLAAYGGAFFAFKGNKTHEFWRYVEPTAQMATRPGRDGVAAGVIGNGEWRMGIGPNPIASGFATLRYSLPVSGPLSVTVIDIAGRSVVSQTVMAHRTGAVSLDLRQLSAGVYLVKLESDSFTQTQKLVVQK